MREIVANEELVSFCGLYCGACKSYLKEKCPGCREKGKYKKCKMRPCCIEKKISSCADCQDFKNVMDCSKYTNKLWNIFEFVFRTRRSDSIGFIKEKGYETFAEYMAENKLVVHKRH